MMSRADGLVSAGGRLAKLLDEVLACGVEDTARAYTTVQLPNTLREDIHEALDAYRLVAESLPPVTYEHVTEYDSAGYPHRVLRAVLRDDRGGAR